MALATFIFLFFYSPTIKAQNSPLYMTWDNEVGCQLSNNGDDRKQYLQLIADNECLQVCKGSTVIYNLEAYDSSWLNLTWNVAGGVILDQGVSSCQVRWNVSSITGSIGATVTKATGTIILPNLCIEFIKKPLARFAKDPFNFADFDMLDQDAYIEACKDEIINFANGSIDNGGTSLAYYSWDFGDGSFSTAFAPTHSYENSGVYTVKLTVTNACNCQNTYTRNVKVGSKGITITCPGVVCDNQRSTYKIEENIVGATSTPEAPPCGHWTVNGGTILTASTGVNHIDVVWTEIGNQLNINDGFGYVTFNPAGCPVDCNEPATLKIPIIRKNMPIVGDPIVCGNSQQRYTLPQWPTTDFQWEVINDNDTAATIVKTDQRNEILLNPGEIAGIITLRVVYQNTLLNCGGSSEMLITLKSNAIIEGVTETCAGGSESYSILGELSGNWQVKKLPSGPSAFYTGSNITTTFVAPGNYSLTVTGSNFCATSSLLITVKSSVTPLDTEIIRDPYVCPGTPSLFSIVNTIPNTVIGWEVPQYVGTIVGPAYGDEVQVVFNYPIPSNANYAIKVWRENANEPICKSAILTVPLAVEQLAIAPIDGKELPCGSTTETYEVIETTGEIYEWTIYPTEAGSIVANGSREVQVLWNQFSAPKQAWVRLTVTKCNIPRSSEKEIWITNPHLEIVAPQGLLCRDTPYVFSVNATPVLNTTTSGAVTWDFGDGTPVQLGTTVSHTYHTTNTSPLDYSVSVSVAHPNECLETITDTKTVTLAVSPVATITPALVVACTPAEIAVPLTVTVVPGYGTTTSIVWYNESNVAVTQLNVSTPSYTPSAYGSYYAVVTNATCSITTNQAVITNCATDCVVSPTPELTVTATNDCGVVTATGSYIPLLPAPQSSSWSSDQVSPSSCDPLSPNCATFNFSTPGNHVVKYTLNYLVNGLPCSVTKSKVVLVPYIAKVGYTVTCGSSGNNYTVTLLDQSLFYATTSIQTWEFLLNGVVQPQLGSDSINQRTLSLAPGNYTLRLTITGSGYPACYEEIPLVLPAFPNPDFTFENNVCVGKATHFAASSQPGVTYSWSFGDDTYNLQQNPYREYEFGTPHFVTLRVTNRYGCYRETIKLVTTLRNDQIGVIDTPAFACPGAATTLNCTTSQGSPSIASYQWLYNNVPIEGATTNPYTAVLASGSYAVEVGNANGCTQRMNTSVGVAVVRPAITTINGLHNVCVGESITLSVNPGLNASLGYRWTLNGTLLSTEKILIDTPTDPGDYTYVLEITTPLAGGGSCVNSIEHEVVVAAPPLLLDLYAEIGCNPYNVKLHAIADTSGVFNWSDGQTGSDIEVHHGGAYRVIFTNTSGCSVDGPITVPQSPENYMWIFPYGCYAFCNDTKNNRSLIGPSIDEFENWQWQKEDTITSQNVNSPDEVIPYSIQGLSGTYNLVLQGENQPQECELKSQDMNVKITTCECIIQAETRGSVIFVENPFNHYEFQLFIDNPSITNFTAFVTTNSNDGLIIPSSVIVPPVGDIFTYSFIASDTFNGGGFNVFIDGFINGRGQCHNRKEISIANIPPIQPRLLETAKQNMNLVVIPNPVKNEVQLAFDYGFEKFTATSSISVYDLLGRELEHYIPQNPKDIWHLNMSSYQAGQYIVVMRLNGAIVQQKNLVLTH